MRRLLMCVVFFIAIAPYAGAQSTAMDVYKVFQNNCTFSSCHDHDFPMLGLDLQGSGPNAMMDVYNNILNVTPANFYAANAGFKYISPGYPERSFIFRKSHNGLDPTIELHPDEGQEMPAFGEPLTEVEAEIIRQWILYGAPLTGQVVDTNLIIDFYNNSGIQSVPNPPVPPADGEGFRLHLGPFFIPPGEEEEVFIKFDPEFTEDVEVNAVEIFMGNQSHHFILYKFFEADEEICGIPTGGIGANDFPDGFRDIDLASHTSANFQVGAQYTGVIDLPYNTAFFWNDSSVLDLNSHYINDNQDHVLAAEVYINVYTQPAGTAVQEMEAIMIPNLDIDIPNNGQEVTFTENLPVAICFPDGIYVWATTCHTHKLGTDYDIYKTDLAGNVTDHIYDASCFIDGVPGCLTEFYDYQHPPTRVFEDYYRLTSADAIRHQASYINNGPEDVGWGFTSEDEMMLFFFFYVRDTAGLSIPLNTAPLAQDDTSSTQQGSPVSISVLENDSDINGMLDPESVVVVSGPSNGAAVVNVDGSITYTPAIGFFGTDTFEYVVCDNGEPVYCDTAEVVVEVDELPSGIFSEGYSKLTAYPNPSIGALFISDPELFIKRLSLRGLQGQEVAVMDVTHNSGLIQIDLIRYGIPEGTYFLIAEGDDGRKGMMRFVFLSAR